MRVRLSLGSGFVRTFLGTGLSVGFVRFFGLSFISFSCRLRFSCRLCSRRLLLSQTSGFFFSCSGLRLQAGLLGHDGGLHFGQLVGNDIFVQIVIAVAIGVFQEALGCFKICQLASCQGHIGLVDQNHPVDLVAANLGECPHLLVDGKRFGLGSVRFDAVEIGQTIGFKKNVGLLQVVVECDGENLLLGVDRL